MKSTLITVSKEDIANGTPEDPQSCPIALAVKRATGAERASVHFGLADRYVCEFGTSLEDGNCGWSAVANIPKRVGRWIDAFDDTRYGAAAPAPTVFDITYEVTAVI